MNIELKTSIVPVLDWADTSDCPHTLMEKNTEKGGWIWTHHIIKDLKDDDLCVYIFYNDYNNGLISNIFIGRVVKYLVPIPGRSTPAGCIFAPIEKIKVKDIVYDKFLSRPKAVMLKSKKL